MPQSERKLRPVEVRALEPYRIWLRYDDGVEGEVDLSDMAGQGVFAAWEDHEFFSAVRLGPRGSIVWSDDIDTCGDALYMELTGMSPRGEVPAANGPMTSRPLAT